MMAERKEVDESREKPGRTRCHSGAHLAREDGIEKLEEELEGLKARLRLKEDLSIAWMPDASSGLEGEVKGRVIYVYSEDLKEALNTLRHEVLDLLISRVLSSQQEIANRLIQLLNEKSYKEKEALVEMLTGLLR